MQNDLKTWIVSLTLAILASACTGEASESTVDVDEAPMIASVVEAACGQDLFGLAGEGCDLAVRFDGKAYFVDGTSIYEHGDAHADDGFCNAIQQARVTGRVEGDRFVVASFELLPSGG